MLATAVGMLLEGEQRAHQLVLRDVYAKTVEAGELRHGVERKGEHDGLSIAL